MAEQMKPCPFCGGCAKFNCRSENENFGYNESYTISCTSCGASVFGRSKEGKGGWIDDPNHEGLEDTYARWNNRAQPAAVDVPAGWRFVPVIQTFEMETAGAEAVLCGPGAPDDWRHASAASIWAAMLEASPEFKP